MTDKKSSNENKENAVAPKLVITHGLPGSGKSTWAEEEVKRINSSGGKAIRVNRDDIRTHLYGADYHKGNPDKKKEQEVTNVQRKLTENSLKDGYHVYNDDTNLNPRFLPNLVKLANEYGAEIEQKHFDVDVETCKQRNSVRGESGGRFVPEHVIDRMANNAYGKDGRIKEFKLGESGVFAYDRAGSDGERLVEEFNKEQQKRYPAKSHMLANFDADGTLCDVREVSDRYMSDKKKRNFHMFHTQSEFSPANEDVLRDAKRAYEEGYTVSVTTARSDDYAQPTINWLKNNGVPVSLLFMRKSGDYRPDYEVKKEMIDEIRASGYEFAHAWDDNPAAVSAFREKGVNVTALPFHKAIPMDSSEGANKHNVETVQESPGDEGASSRTAHIGVDKNGNRIYPKIEVESPFKPGTCIRCGSTLKDKSKTIGDRCKQLSK